MKNLTNILSYLWLLLLMAVTACSDLENEVDEMQQQLQEADLVELTIHPHVPGMKAGTRSIETDALTSIKVLAFDESKKLIKMVDATNVTTGTSGSFSVKVPSKTRIIHFIGNPPNGVTLPVVGDSEDKLKTITTSGDMSYWGYESFNNVTELKAFKGKTLTLYRNKAKISLTAADGVTASIAGVANAYQDGVLVPHNNDGFNFDLDTYDYQTLPSNTTKFSDPTGGAFTYVFEHPNDSKADALNVICKVGDLYYKVALAKKVNDEMVYYDIIRNHQYNIKINQVDTNLGKANFDDAADVNNEPINDVEVVEDKQVALLVTTSPSSTCSYDNTTYTVTVTTTENKLTDISTLSFSVLDTDVYQLTGTTGVTDNGNSNYTVTADQAVFTFTLEDGYIGKEVSNSITFEGDGTHVVVTPATANLNLSTFADMYEMYFDDGNLGGSDEYDKFFYDRNNVNLQTQTLTTQYVDAGANGSSLAHNHVNAAINMQSNSTIKFTIAEERYLTLLVASNNDNNPSIQLSNGTWTTAGNTEDLTNGTYNFGNGEIGTAGRLIRYTLPAGTYTLQRGNNDNDKDYLLYYMRVSKDKPIMTDAELVQVQTNSYVLSWSDNTKDRFYKENDEMYFVDEEAKTFTAKLNHEEWQNVSLTTTNLDISTVTWTFDNGNEESQGTENTPEEHSYDGNETVSIGNHNAGTYTLSGTVVPNASYKYAAFYDRLPLSPVNFEVKNTIKVGLYDSWDGNAAPVSTYTDGKPLIIGFKWPSSTLPIEPDEQIQFTIPDVWVRDASGSGITYDEPNNGTRTYRIGNENNRYHPRTDWTYKIEWRDVAAENITATTNTDDIYFSYNGTIGKSVTIATPITNDNLDVALDFYADLDNNSQIDDSENRSDNRYENLQLGTTHFYLKATISYEDSENYDNQPVQLQGAYPAYNGAPNDGSVIDWAGSRVSGDGNNNITYTNNNGNELKFTVHRGVTEYLIEWVFKPTQQYQNGDIAFTYTLSNNQGYNVSGESPVIAFTNESNYSNNNVLNLPLNISLDFYRKYSNGTTDDNYDNLIYGVSRVGLKATITIPNEQNAADYYDKIVYLQGAFSDTSGTGNAGIHWDNSRDSGNDFEIAYKTDVNHDGTQLQFKIENGKTEYDIEWVFKGGSRYNSSNNSGNVGFTYTISAQNGSHQISGQNSATLAIKRSADIFNGLIEFNEWNSTIFDEIFPIGTNISLTYSKGGIAKFLNGYWQMLRIPEFEDAYESDANFYIRVGTEPINFDVSEKIKLYNNESNAYESDLSSSLVALRIQGNEGSILQRVTVTAPPSAFPNNNPDYVP
ncbi:MAG: hypothetical protein J6A40_09890 [Bacteroides sp.]|nr:hypothetical protein [Bacteroides sp.]